MADPIGFLKSVLNGTYNGMSQAGEGLAQGAYDAATLPRDVYQGKVNVDPRTMSDEEFGRTLNLAGNVAGGGITMGSAPEGALGMFAGRRSQTFPTEKAQAFMEQNAGVPVTAEQVRQNTGIFRGVDGQMRYEIPDNAAVIKDSYAQKMDQWGAPDTPIALRDVMDHPEFMKAYPELGGIGVVHDPSMKGASYMQPWNGAPAQIKFNANNPDALSSLLHETQHAVQNYEGFAPGASPKLDEITRAKPIALKGQDFADAVANNAPQADISRLNYEFERAKWEAYARSAGEVEARAVQRRQNYSPWERENLHPIKEESYPTTPGFKVPAEQQWVRGKELPFPTDQYSKNLPFMAQYLGK